MHGTAHHAGTADPELIQLLSQDWAHPGLVGLQSGGTLRALLGVREYAGAQLAKLAQVRLKFLKAGFLTIALGLGF